MSPGHFSFSEEECPGLFFVYTYLYYSRKEYFHLFIWDKWPLDYRQSSGRLYTIDRSIGRRDTVDCIELSG